jgi:putative ABC transport system permease protein
MIRNYFTRFWRNAIKNKIFTFINILGLSVGIAVFTLIALWAWNEFSYDRFNRNLDDIYRIEIGGSVYMVSAIGPSFKNEFPEIEKFVRFSDMGSSLLTCNKESIVIENMILADSSLFDIFTYEFISGDPREALVTPFSLVLTETTAGRLFGDADPIGKAVVIDNKYEAYVTGVVRDVQMTHMPVDAIASFVTLGKVMPQPDYLYSFGTTQFPTYFLIRKGVDIGNLEKRMTGFTNELYVQHGGTAEGNENVLVPLRDIYFHEINFPHHLHGNLKFVYIFLLVSILTLVIACINFINLTIARASATEKEVGVKKVFGASSNQLAFQFLLESVIISYISSLLAVVLIRIIIPEFNQLTGGNLSLGQFMKASYLLLYFLVVSCIGVIAGIYPAIRLSAFNPVKYLRRFGGRGISRSPFRKGLVVFQFTVSVILMLSVSVVSRQLNFMKLFDTGFNNENIILLRLEGDIGDRMEAFKNEIISIPDVEDIAFTGAPPGVVNNYEGFIYQGNQEGFPVFTVDPSFLPLLEVKITEGRNFSWERPNDRFGVCILNRQAVELFGIPDPVGSFLKHEYYLTTIPKNDIEVIGVVDNYHYVSPRDSIGPALFCFGRWFNTACVKVRPGNMPVTLKQIEDVWNKFAPGYPFTFQYLDDYYERQYKGEVTLSKILIYFALIAILIACLGLLGLTSFITQEKTREIGVRKVFGATTGLIIRLLSINYLKWVIVAVLIGSPLAVITMKKWLANFAYHTDIPLWLLLAGAAALLLLSMATIVFHIIRYSRTNPVNALKYE